MKAKDNEKAEMKGLENGPDIAEREKRDLGPCFQVS